MHDITYRFFQEKDGADIERLLQELHSYHYKHNEEVFNEHIEGADRVVDYTYKNDIVYVAECNGSIVGMIDFSDDRNDTSSFMKAEHKIKIHNLIITESMRGRGIGTTLLNICKEYSDKNGGIDIELGAYAFNIDAIRFYVNNGFRTCFVHMEYKA